MEMSGLSVQMKPGGNAGLCTAVALSWAAWGAASLPAGPRWPHYPRHESWCPPVCTHGPGLPALHNVCCMSRGRHLHVPACL